MAVNNINPVTTFISTGILPPLVSYLGYDVLMFLRVPLCIVRMEVFSEDIPLGVTLVTTDGVWSFLETKKSQ